MAKVVFNKTAAPDREIQSDPGTVGHITMCTVEATKEMKVHGAGDDSGRAPIIPLLYDPILQAMHGKRMLFSGLERQGDQADSKDANVHAGVVCRDHGRAAGWAGGPAAPAAALN